MDRRKEERNDEFGMERKLWRSKNYAKQKTEEEVKKQPEENG
jgi:hypothetical protein